MSKHNAPTRAQLIHRLIEERARVIRLISQISRIERPALYPEGLVDASRDEARRQIEREVLCPQR